MARRMTIIFFEVEEGKKMPTPMKAILAITSPSRRRVISRLASSASSASILSPTPTPTPSLLSNGPLSHPTFALGNDVFAQGSNAIVGLSAANSYYNRERTAETVAWSAAWFKRTHAFIPGILSRYTFEAKGHSHTKSRQKAVQAENRLRRFAEEGEQLVKRRAVGFAAKTGEVSIPKWTDIQTHPAFLESLFFTRERLYDSSIFRTAVHESCLEVVTNGRRPNAADSIDESIDLAREFLLQELAFLWRCDEILGANEPMVYIYHRRWPVFEQFAAGEFFEDERPLENVGFLVVEMKEPVDVTLH